VLSYRRQGSIRERLIGGMEDCAAVQARLRRCAGNSVDNSPRTALEGTIGSIGVANSGRADMKQEPLVGGSHGHAGRSDSSR
jgi:hypothetical protein